MAKNKIKSRYGALLLALNLYIGPVLAQEDPAQLLGQAWSEYGLQAFSSADEIFSEVAESSQANKEQRWQALLGSAYIMHYQMPGRDPEAAIPLYEALLKEVGDASEWRGQLLGRLADCHVELVPAQVGKARSLYKEAISALAPESLLIPETSLRLLSSYIQRPDVEEIKRGLLLAEELAPRFIDTPFASVFHGLRAEMAFFIADYVALVDALDKQYRAGINNISVKELVLFRLARIHEVELGDYKRAEQYYRRLAAEVPSSKKAHFALLRADELKIGKLDSDYAPPLSTQVESDMAKERPDDR
jgi:tetratricopeptide (TPR) repeat protein